jgi:hypothetical protein
MRERKLMYVKNLTEGIKAVRGYQRRKDMEKAKLAVNLALVYVVAPAVAIIAIRKIDKKCK